MSDPVRGVLSILGGVGEVDLPLTQETGTLDDDLSSDVTEITATPYKGAPNRILDMPDGDGKSRLAGVSIAPRLCVNAAYAATDS